MIFLTIIIFVLVLGVLVLAHELGHFAVARLVGMRVEEFGFGFPPRIASFKRGDTVYSINLIPFGGFVKILGENGESAEADSFASQSALKRFFVLLAGVTMNVVLAWVLFSLALTLGIPTVISQGETLPGNARLSEPAVTILLVEPDGPAAAAGMRPGDAILAISGERVTALQTALDITSQKAGQQLIYEIKRGNEIIDIRSIPRSQPPVGQGPLGITLGLVARVSYPWYEAVYRGVGATVSLGIQIVIAFIYLIAGFFSGHSEAGSLTGPIGIAVLTRDAAKLGFVYVLQFTALLSVNLAIINVLPFPALDGGRIFFLVMEKVRGKKLNLKLENYTNTIGFFLLISLLVWVSIRDVRNFSGQLTSLWHRILSVF